MFEVVTYNLVTRIRTLSLISVPNFTTFYHTVLLAAIDSNGRINKKRYKHYGGFAAWPPQSL